jgi:ubiquinone/menaquinone biosynthesis C-methylase UbiE
MSTSNGYKGLAMEGAIATWYARNTRKDVGRHKLMAAELAAKIAPGSDVLEIAPGPGYFCIELKRLGNFKVTGLDISRTFVDIARREARQAGLEIDFQLGNASAMPFSDESFDFTFCQAAFKNFSQPVEAIAEMHRVLRPGGTAVINDLRADVTDEEMQREVDQMGLGTLDRWMTKWIFKTTLMKSAYGVDAMQELIARTPFKQGDISVRGMSLEVWLRK